MPFTVLDSASAVAAPVLGIGAPVENFGMQLQDFQSEIWAQLQNRLDVNPDGTYTRLNRWINWGYVNIAGMLDLKELWASFALPTVASQPLYTMPIQLSWIKRVAIEDQTDFVFQGGEELTEIDVETFRTLSDSNEIQRSPLFPQAWFRYGRMLVLWPSPDAVYNLSVDCKIRPLPLTDVQDCSILPTEFDEAIVYAALERAWRALRNPAAAAVAANDKLMIIRSLLNTDAEERGAQRVSLTPARSRSDLYRGRI